MTSINKKISNQKQIIDTLKLKLKGDEILYKSQKLALQGSLKQIMILTMQIIFY